MERSSTRGSRGRHRIQGTVLISREVEGVDSWKVFTGPEALGHKQKHGRLPLNIRKSFFIVRVPEHWYRFSRAGCGASVLGDKSCLDSHLWVTLLEQGCGADVPQRSQPSLTLLWCCGAKMMERMGNHNISWIAKHQHNITGGTTVTKNERADSWKDQ